MDNIYGLEEIHHKLLAGLVKLDHFCRENQIRYSLHASTAAFDGKRATFRAVPRNTEKNPVIRKSQDCILGLVLQSLSSFPFFS